MYLGVELEIDRGGEESSNAERILEIANYDATHMYMKHDGSIEDGFEMVTHPISLDYHQTKMPWREIFDKALEMGYRSHKTSTCGLHIHVSRDALGPDHDAQEETIARIVYFVEAHWNELLKFSRRTEANIMRWASRYGIEANTKAVYDKAIFICFSVGWLAIIEIEVIFFIILNKFIVVLTLLSAYICKATAPL